MSELAQLLYDRIVVKADDWGIITGDSFELKGETIPLSSRTFQELDAAVQEMVGQCLVWYYEPEGVGPLVQVRKFDDHQPSSLWKKRTAPKLPLHPDWKAVPEDDRSMKLLENPGNDVLEESRVEKSREEKSSARERDPRLDHEAIIGYKGIAHLHVPIAFRDDWIACADEVGTDKLLAATKTFIGNGWNKQNVNGIMDFARKGGEGKHGKHSRRDEEESTEWEQDLQAAVEHDRRKYADAGSDGPGGSTG